MNHILLLSLILISFSSFAQLPMYDEPINPSVIRYDKYSPPKKLDTIYYPFYDDVQMIKVADPLDSYYNPTFIKSNHFNNSEDVYPIYLFRNKKGKIISEFNTIDRKFNYSKLKKVNEINKPETHNFRFKHTQKHEAKYWGQLGLYPIYLKKGSKNQFDTYTGLIDTMGRIIVEPLFDHIECKDSVLIVTREGKFGILSVYGKEIAPPIYESFDFENTYQDLILVKKNGLYGMIDKKNNLLIPFEYDHIAKSKYQPSLYEIRKGLDWQFYNPRNKTIGKLKFSNNNVRIRDGQILIYDDAWIMADTNGNILVKSKIEITEMVNEHRFLIMKWEKGYHRYIIDENANIINDKDYYYLNKLNKNSLIGAYDVVPDEHLTYGRPSKWVILDENGNNKTGEVYDGFEKLNDDYYQVWIKKKAKIINARGEKVFSLDYESCGKMNDHYFLLRNNKKTRFLNLDKNIVRYSDEYDETQGMSEGMISVQLNEKWGFLDSNLNLNIPIVFEKVSRFKNGTSEVVLDGKSYVINKNGENFANEKYDNHQQLEDGFVKVSKDGKFGVINIQGNLTVPIIYEGIGNLIKSETGYYLIAKKDNYYGIINEKNEIVQPFVFHTCAELSVHASGDYNRRNGFYAYCTIVKRNIIEYYYFNFEDVKSYMRTGENSTKGFKKVSNLECEHCIGKKYGIKNWYGELVVPMVYDGIGDLKKNTFQVYLTNQGGGLVDTTGKVLIPVKYKYLYDLGSDNDYIQVGRHQGGWGLYTYSGKMIADTLYGGFEKPILGLIPFRANFNYRFVKGKGWEHDEKKLGLMDAEGKIIIEPHYEQIDIGDNKNELIRLRCKHQTALITTKGKFVQGNKCTAIEPAPKVKTKKELRKEKRQAKRAGKKKGKVRFL